jgi:excisionase family DNA binding protein
MTTSQIHSADHQSGDATTGKPRTYTVEQAASLLGISRSTAYECVRSGAIPSLRFRRRIVISASVIEHMLRAERPLAGDIRESA